MNHFAMHGMQGKKRITGSRSSGMSELVLCTDVTHVHTYGQWVPIDHGNRELRFETDFPVIELPNREFIEVTETYTETICEPVCPPEPPPEPPPNVAMPGTLLLMLAGLAVLWGRRWT